MNVVIFKLNMKANLDMFYTAYQYFKWTHYMLIEKDFTSLWMHFKSSFIYSIMTGEF
jgi:hypothetical protein